MGDFFADLRSGIEMPQVVMNQGPLPGSGGLPRPLHDTADGRINYNSSLLGNLTPYAYGEPGYLSSQTAYLNIPHKIQKIVPVVFLPEARRGATEFFDLTHPVDDGDLAFALRLDRNSLFCTGLKNGDMRRAGLGTAIDPLINLPTVNYILSGVQLGVTEGNAAGDLWSELLFNLDRTRFGKRMGAGGRDYQTNPLSLSDILHIVQHCIRPLGITRGSEKQGGQNEGTSAPATWPVSFVVSITIDGKESNVLNLWHHTNLSAGDDLVLCLKLMPLRPYTLNHYYKGVKRQSWAFPDKEGQKEHYVWQLVPALANLEPPSDLDSDVRAARKRLSAIPPAFRELAVFPHRLDSNGDRVLRRKDVDETTPWQDLGFWHVARTQVMTSRYGVEEYWHNDLANSLRTNHLDITLQPYFTTPPQMPSSSSRGRGGGPIRSVRQRRGGGPAGGPPAGNQAQPARPSWAPLLGLERLGGRLPDPSLGPARARPQFQSTRGLPPPAAAVAAAPAAAPPTEDLDANEWAQALGINRRAISPIGELDFTDDLPPPSQAAATAASAAPEEVVQADPSAQAGAARRAAAGGAATGKKRATGGVKGVVGGSLLRSDGTSEPSMVGML
jgi:hypothetical protein